MFNASMKAGYAFSSAIRNFFSTSNCGMVIAHRIEGRRRYTCKNIINNANLCDKLEQIIGNFPGVTSCTVSALTGSITVTYTQEDKYIDALFDALSHHLAGKHAVQEKTIIPTNILTVSDNINDSLRYARKRLSLLFNHTEPLFLSRILGIALFIYGINRIVLQGERPSGPQLFLWGLALVMRQSHPDPRKIFGKEQDLNTQNKLNQL